MDDFVSFFLDGVPVLTHDAEFFLQFLGHVLFRTGFQFANVEGVHVGLLTSDLSEDFLREKMHD